MSDFSMTGNALFAYKSMINQSLADVEFIDVNAINIHATSNQLRFGADPGPYHYFNINPVAADRTTTWPDPLANGDIVYTEGVAQLINSDKTFKRIKLNDGTGVPVVTVAAEMPAANRSHTIAIATSDSRIPVLAANHTWT